MLSAPLGSYDEIWVADATKRIVELEGRFDLVVSWQVLEHVKPLVEVVDNLRSYLRPGGHFIGQLSGAFSFFGLANRALPDRLNRKLVSTLTGRDADTVFPAHYDHCWDSALTAMFSSWEAAEVTPRYLGAQYLRFLPSAQRLYLMYEESVMRRGKRNLATHYLIDAER